MSAADLTQDQSVQASTSPPAWYELVATFSIATATIGFAPILHLANPALGISVEVLLGIAIVISVPTYAPAIAIFVLFFQNLFVSILSPLVPLPSDLDFIKGYNFLVCSVMWLATFGLYVLGRRSQSAEVNRIMRWGVITLAVVSLYFAIGFLQDGQPATVYLRNIVLPLFLFQLSLLTAATYEVRITPFLVALAVILICCGYIEPRLPRFLAGCHQRLHVLGFRRASRRPIRASGRPRCGPPATCPSTSRTASASTS
ncbi:hypothetical protein ACVOMS_20655 [Bradyrhizobium guangxiense]